MFRRMTSFSSSRTASECEWVVSQDTAIERVVLGVEPDEIDILKQRTVIQVSDAVPLPVIPLSFPPRPHGGVQLSFEVDYHNKTTSLVVGGLALFSYSTHVAPGSMGYSTHLMNRAGKVIASHHNPTKGADTVCLAGSDKLVKRAAWMSKNNLFSRGCARFKHRERVYRWHSVDELGKISLVLFEAKSGAWIARFRSCGRIRRSGRMHTVSSIELNPVYESIWDQAIFSLLVLQSLRGGVSPIPLSHEELEHDAPVYSGFL